MSSYSDECWDLAEAVVLDLMTTGHVSSAGQAEAVRDLSSRLHNVVEVFVQEQEMAAAERKVIEDAAGRASGSSTGLRRTE